MWAGRVQGGIHREMGPALDVKAEQIGIEIKHEQRLRGDWVNASIDLNQVLKLETWVSTVALFFPLILTPNIQFTTKFCPF